MDLLPFVEYMSGFPRQRLAAGVLMHDDDGRVLLVEPTYKPTWEIPGGVVEADEAPWDAAVREVREELGLEIRLGRPLVIDHLDARAAAAAMVVPHLEAGRITDREARQATEVLTGGLYWVFDGGHVTQQDVEAMTPDGAELRSIRLVDADQVHVLAKQSLARRIDAALDAITRGTGPILCSDGIPVSGSSARS